MEGYSEIIKSSSWDGSTLHATVSDVWGQGRTIFGGLTCGLALYALQRTVDDDRPLRSVMTSFIGPIRAGEIEVTTRTLRTGRNVTHAEATIQHNSALCSTLLACYGSDRESPIHVDSTPMPVLPPPEELTALPFVPGLSPEFSRYIDYRWMPDSIPYQGKGAGTASGWVRLHGSGPMRTDHFALLVDAWPSPALAMLQAPTPISSLTWNMEIVNHDAAYLVDDWWAIHAVIESIDAGYAHGSAYVWAPDGALVARSQQTVSVYKR